MRDCKILDFRNGEPGVAAIRALPDVNNPLSSRLTNGRSRTPRTRAEHRGIGADSQRQSQSNGHGAALCTAQRTDCGSQIAKKRDDGLNHAKSPFQVFSKSLAAAKASQDEGG